MTPVHWRLAGLDEVPAGDQWLTPAEQRDQLRFTVPKRRADWRLGRWVAKATLTRALGLEPGRVSVVAAHDGAPEPLLDGEPVAGLSLSISHRAGVGLAVVCSGAVVGGDLEIAEPRSEAFVQEWFGATDQDLVHSIGHREHALALLWSAKEASAKVLRDGLRLDPRDASVSVDLAGLPFTASQAGWRRSTVVWASTGRRIEGWWRIDGDRVLTLAGNGVTIS
jgi:4'-phosphopantetheinyl transferase